METILLSIGLLAGCIAVMLFFMSVLRKVKNRRGKGRIQWTGLCNSDIVVASEVGHAAGEGDVDFHLRVRWFDPENGKMKFIRVYEDMKCNGYSGGFIVLSGKNNIVLLDGETAEEIINTKKNKTRGSGKERIVKTEFDTAKNEYSLVTESGIRYTEKIPVKPRNTSKVNPKPENGNYVLRQHGENETKILTVNGHEVKDQFFIDGQIIYSDEKLCLVLHKKTLEKTGKILVSGVSATGKVLWAISQNQMGVKHHYDEDRDEAARYKESIVCGNGLVMLVFECRHSSLVMIDIQQGNVRWKANG